MSLYSNISSLPGTSLNGWWDFCPPGENDPMLVLPEEDWVEDSYLAPSSWTGRGSECFNYPALWQESRQGWLRRFIRINKRANRRVLLQFDGVGPRTTVFLNGSAVGETVDAFTSFEVDLTDVADQGVNEIILRIMDTPQDDDMRLRHPAGTGDFSGILQDVRLVDRPDVHIASAGIITSVAKKHVSAEMEIVNSSRRSRTVKVQHDIVRWKRSMRLNTAPVELELGTKELKLQPDETLRYTLQLDWKNPLLWSPTTPELYVLRCRILEDGRAPFVRGQRFGFREIAVDGARLYLNGSPLHLFSDHGGVPDLHFGLEAWIKRWFQLLHAGGLNHARLPCACATRKLLEMADETGLLLTVESALDGENKPLSVEAPEFWIHAADHLRRLVIQKRNHPSIVMWSVGRHVYRNLTAPSPAFKSLPALRGLIRELDPSRIVYFGGDSMHWNSDGQELMDGPPGRYESIYDSPGLPRLATADAAPTESNLYLRLARAHGAAIVAVPGILDTMPLSPETPVSLTHSSYEKPGLKFPVAAAKSSNLLYWSTKKERFASNRALRVYAAEFEPRAVIDTTPATSVFSGQSVQRRIVLCNDSSADVEGYFTAAFRYRDEVFDTRKFEVTVPAGGRTRVDYEISVPEDMASGVCRIDYEWFDNSSGKVADCRIPFRVFAPLEMPRALAGRRMAVFGSERLADWLEETGANVQRLDSLSKTNLKKVQLLVLSPNCIEPGKDSLPALREFVQSGGGVVALEQENSPFHGIPRVPRTAWIASIRDEAHPVFAGLSPEDLICWNNRPIAVSGYTCPNTDEILAEKKGCALIIEILSGKGRVLACQLRIFQALENEPAAGQLFFNLLARACVRDKAGVRPEHPALQGDFLPIPPHTGQGFADEIWILNDELSRQMADRLIRSTIRANADYPPVQIFAIGKSWSLIHRTNGWVSALAFKQDMPACIFTRFHADVEKSDLLLEGEGTARIYVGGELYEAVMHEGKALIKNVILQRGYNAMLIIWKPAHSETSLRPVWINSEGRVQTAFEFR